MQAEYIRALIVILFVAVSVFYFSRKSIEPLLQPKEFLLWRNTWITITFSAFLVGNFWLYILSTTLIIIYALKSLKPIYRDKHLDNRFGLYLVLLVAIPQIEQSIPSLIDINYVRLLSITILLPMFISKKWRQGAPAFGKPLTDKLLLGLIILSSILAMRGTSATDAIRYGIGFFLEWFLPYFIASRVIKDMQQLKIALIAFTFGCLIAGSIGFVEYLTKWLLYNPLADSMNVIFDINYIGRGNDLRALSSLGHPLILGLVMMVSMGFYLFLSSSIQSNFMRRFTFLVLLAGLIAPISRGPWLGAAIIALLFIATGPKIVKRFTMLLAATLIAIVILPTFPGGQKIIKLMPFIGSTDQFNVDYREALFEKSLIIIDRSPYFGVYDARLEPEMEDMIQGEGIVDIVNTYLQIALAYGLIGLAIFIWFFVVVLFKARKSMKRIKNKKSEEYICGRSIIATMIGVLIAISSVSTIGLVPTVLYLLSGFLLSYSRIVNNSIENKSLK